MNFTNAAGGVDTPPVPQPLQRRELHSNLLLKISLFVPAQNTSVTRPPSPRCSPPLAAEAAALGSLIRVQLQVYDDVGGEQADFGPLAPLHVDACEARR